MNTEPTTKSEGPVHTNSTGEPERKEAGPDTFEGEDGPVSGNYVIGKGIVEK